MTVNGAVIDATAMAAVVTFLVSVLKPFLEELPFAAVGSKTHDASVQLLNILLNVGLVVLVSAATGGLSLAAVLPLALQALAQAAGAQVLYTTTTRLGGSVNDRNGAPAAASAAQVVDTTATVSPL